jgi:NCAIR mutase (PurE)-related protein
MQAERIRSLLEQLQQGQVPLEEVYQALVKLPYEDLGFARIDHHRSIRQGFPEVIYGGGKTPQQTATIFTRLAAQSDQVLATHASPDAAERVCAEIPEAQYHPVCHALVLDRNPTRERIGNVVVVCAGTSDMAVAEEAVVTADLMGARVIQIMDAGVAGIHRILAEYHTLSQARAIVVVAGMEGALPSVVGGLVSVPVIAVPTSVGYGASFGGVAALLGMLNSCASGVSVVNIDNGFGAGYQAALINRIGEPANSPTT